MKVWKSVLKILSFTLWALERHWGFWSGTWHSTAVLQHLWGDRFRDTPWTPKSMHAQVPYIKWPLVSVGPTSPQIQRGGLNYQSIKSARATITKSLRLCGLNSRNVFFLTVLEAESSRSRCQQGWLLLRSVSFIVYRWPASLVSSYGLHCRQILYHLSHQGSPLCIYLGPNLLFLEKHQLY